MPSRRQLVLLFLLLLVAIIPRVQYLDAEFVRVDEWGMPQLTNYARNYNRFGLTRTKLLPTAGLVNGEMISYVNHPPLAYLTLAGWTAITEDSERAFRILGVIFFLITAIGLYTFTCTVFDPKVALTTTFFYSFMPMSIYLGRMFTVEGSSGTVMLLSFIPLIHWYRTGHRKWFLATAGLLATSTFLDYYPILLAPYFLGLILWGPKKERRLGLAALASVPFFCVVAWVLWVLSTGYIDHFAAGASSHATPWQYWVDPSYYKNMGVRIVLYLGAVPALLTLLWGKFAQRSSEQMMWCAGILYYPLIDFAIFAHWVANHQYRVMFWMVPLALAAGHLLSQRRKAVVALVATIFLAMSAPPTLMLFEVIYPGDPGTARQIRELTTDDDILIGLPPHMQYYVDRPAVVPFHYLWKHQALLEKDGELFKRLHRFAKPGPGRLILFPKFLVVGVAPPDWSKTFDGIEGLRRVTGADVDVHVWEWDAPPKDH